MIEIPQFLHRLGITKCYIGYKRVILLLELALENEDRLEAVTKELYMETAHRLGCNWAAVERSVRTVVHKAWMTNPDFLMEIAGYPLTQAPTSSDFLAFSVNYLQRTADPSDACPL